MCRPFSSGLDYTSRGSNAQRLQDARDVLNFHPLICTGPTIFDGSIYATTWGTLDYTYNTDTNKKEVWEQGILLKINKTEDRWERVVRPNEVRKAQSK